MASNPGRAICVRPDPVGLTEATVRSSSWSSLSVPVRWATHVSARRQLRCDGASGFDVHCQRARRWNAPGERGVKVVSPSIGQLEASWTYSRSGKGMSPACPAAKAGLPDQRRSRTEPIVEGRRVCKVTAGSLAISMDVQRSVDAQSRRAVPQVVRKHRALGSRGHSDSNAAPWSIVDDGVECHGQRVFRPAVALCAIGDDDLVLGAWPLLDQVAQQAPFCRHWRLRVRNCRFRLHRQGGNTALC